MKNGRFMEAKAFTFSARSCSELPGAGTSLPWHRMLPGRNSKEEGAPTSWSSRVGK